MKNLKKTLAVVLAFAMILSMGAISTFAYSDVAEGTVVSEAVEILSNLGIITGYEDGTFKPAETVTRAQMAAIICRTLGYEDQAQSSMGSTVFDDVAADHWASGYINVAQAQQIINGYGNGKFGPEDKVTYEQAVKMIVAALGYDLAAASKGGYPTGYLAIASSKGITKNANGRVGDAAARSSIAVLVYNSLEVALMDQTSWSTGAAGDEYGMTEETVLSKYLGVQKIEATVTGTPLTALAEATAYDPEAEAKVAFADVKEWKFDNKSYVLKDYEGTELEAEEGVNADLIADADQYLGKKVVAYVGLEADATTGEKMIYAIAEKQGANATLKLNATQLVSDTENGKLVYKKAGSNKKYDVKIVLAATYVNYADVSADPVDTDEVIALVENGGTIELIDSNPASAGYETLIAVAYDAEAVVEEVEVDGTDIFFSTYYDSDSLEAIDTESETELVVVYKDGAVVEATTIAAGDTVSTVEIGDVARALYVSSKTVTGSVDGWTDDGKLTIAGEEYVASALGNETFLGLQNKEGIFYLNVDGQITYADASVAKGAYGIILNSGKDTGMGAKPYATILMADGTEKAYNYAKNVTYTGSVWDDENDEWDAVTALSKTAEQTAGIIADLMGHGQAANEAYAWSDTVDNLVFEIKIKNDEIKALKAVTVGAAGESKYNADTTSLGSKTFDETSVMFALKNAYDAPAAKIEEGDIKVGKSVEMLADDETYTIALATGEAIENGIYKLALGYELATSIAADSELIVITGKKTISYNDDAATKITGLQAGKEVEILLYNEDGFRSNNKVIEDGEVVSEFAAASLAIGDIIVTSAVNEETKVADDFTVIYDKSANSVLVADNSDKDLYYDIEVAVDSDTNFIWFENAMDGFITEAGANGDGAGDNFMVINKAANCVLVDYTEDADEPEIGKKTLSKSIIGNTTKYVSNVFVRTFDEQIIDVIVYRTNVAE